MRVSDIMALEVVSVRPETPLAEAADLMLRKRISGLPVIDAEGKLAGILTEGDLLRRPELGTDRKRPRWLEFLLSPGKLADEYVRTHGRKVSDVMTRDVITVHKDTPLDKAISLMTERRVKRLPVLQEGMIVGIVSRADVMRALAGNLRESATPVSAEDGAIRDAIFARLKAESWAPIALLNLTVKDGTVDLWGSLLDERERNAVRVAVENVPGVTGVRDHLVYVEPYSGSVVYRPDMLEQGPESKD
ncbi:CBS domain-containing protein [Microvirga flavescens]|uniref:CBS domain-containing protein n=1 Tax=Microvirga flavescens TaxID=2249811 RepID=UPI000DD5684D|nr:CBS domain-containing protein [Microvirga flavescens]